MNAPIDFQVRQILISPTLILFQTSPGEVAGLGLLVEGELILTLLLSRDLAWLAKCASTPFPEMLDAAQHVATSEKELENLSQERLAAIDALLETAEECASSYGVRLVSDTKVTVEEVN